MLKTFSVEQRQDAADHSPELKFIVYQNCYFEVGEAAADDFAHRLDSSQSPSVLNLGGEFPPFVAFGGQAIRGIGRGSVAIEGELLQPEPVEASITFLRQSHLRRLAACLRGREIMVDARLSVASS